MLSQFKTGLDSWISLWRFLVHLEDLNFYEGLDGCETERTRSICRASGLYAAVEKRSGQEPSGTARPPVRTVVSAFLGGIALERLHGSGDVHYRLFVARRTGKA